jgi:hypothetical protein
MKIKTGANKLTPVFKRIGIYLEAKPDVSLLNIGCDEATSPQEL